IFLKPKILKSFLGFNRNYRFKRGSFYRLLNKIDGWEECSRQIKDCLKNMELKTFFIKSRKGVFCGKYVFQYKKPIPLAWVGIEHTFIQKSKLLKVKLECL
ncbi:MAG: hypothetical protein OEY33_02720, partial [Bdellovibrionales bacterium]|nr:hypothetical protein [Bdellovibrionales bacterium]